LTFKRIHPDDLQGALRTRQFAMKTKSAYFNEFRVKHASGEYRWMRAIGQSEIDTEGNVTYFAGTIEDINELKTAELAAAEQVKQRDSYLSMLSHELRNPVAAIKYALDPITQRFAQRKSH